MQPNSQNTIQPVPGQVAPADTQNGYVQTTPMLFFTKFSLESDEPAELRWASDNTISLVSTQTNTELFHCPVQDILSLSYTTEYSTFKLKDGRKFHVSFNLDAYNRRKGATFGSAAAMGVGAAMGSGGGNAAAVGIDANYFMETVKEEKRGESKWWNDNLQRFGVKVRYISLPKFYALTLLGVVVAFILAGVVIGVVQFMTS